MTVNGPQHDGAEIEVVGRHGSTHEIALGGVAAEVVHKSQGVEVLDPLGDDAQAERMARSTVERITDTARLSRGAPVRNVRSSFSSMTGSRRM